MDQYVGKYIDSLSGRELDDKKIPLTYFSIHPKAGVGSPLA